MVVREKLPLDVLGREIADDEEGTHLRATKALSAGEEHLEKTWQIRAADGAQRLLSPAACLGRSAAVFGSILLLAGSALEIARREEADELRRAWVDRIWEGLRENESTAASLEGLGPPDFEADLTVAAKSASATSGTERNECVRELHWQTWRLAKGEDHRVCLDAGGVVRRIEVVDVFGLDPQSM